MQVEDLQAAQLGEMLGGLGAEDGVVEAQLHELAGQAGARKDALPSLSRRGEEGDQRTKGASDVIRQRTQKW